MASRPAMSVGMYIALPQQTRIGFVRCRSVLCVKKKALLQEVVRNVCCLQRVFLHTTLKVASLPQPGGDVEQPQLMCKYDVIHKTRNT